MDNGITIVSSQSNPLAYLKAIATLVGTIVTGLLGIYASDTPVGQVLLVVSVIATAVATWTVPNALVEGTPAANVVIDAAVNSISSGDEGDLFTASVEGDPAPYDPGAPGHGYAEGDPNRY